MFAVTSNASSAVTTTPVAAAATTTPAVGTSRAATVTAPSRAGTAGKTSDLRAAFGSNATLEDLTELMKSLARRFIKRELP
ncbi:hypothetical protein DPEC_G00192440 [Dallia pectoralis]|uniref:Uncharacterized protein n=1 Tax=Dallia pectoralis TaxID=75939 RepID=A0ACC2GCD7_DALPE|nr:hypothetical protein DPEC_G00192440 [Dallia pectoralis]